MCRVSQSSRDMEQGSQLSFAATAVVDGMGVDQVAVRSRLAGWMGHANDQEAGRGVVGNHRSGDEQDVLEAGQVEACIPRLDFGERRMGCWCAIFSMDCPKHCLRYRDDLPSENGKSSS